MTKEQAEAKIAALVQLGGLNGVVAVANETDMDTGSPCLTFSYAVIPGPGLVYITVPQVPSTQNLADIVNNLPLADGQKPAALAVMLAPSQPGDEIARAPSA